MGDDGRGRGKQQGGERLAHSKASRRNLKRAIEDGKVKVFVQSTQRDRASLEVNAEDMSERGNHFIVSVYDSSSSSEAVKEAKDVDDSSGSGRRVIRMTNSEGILLDCELPT